MESPFSDEAVAFAHTNQSWSRTPCCLGFGLISFDMSEIPGALSFSETVVVLETLHHCHIQGSRPSEAVTFRLGWICDCSLSCSDHAWSGPMENGPV